MKQYDFDFAEIVEHANDAIIVTRADPIDEIRSEGNCPPQLVGPPENPLSHSLELRPGEVPLPGDPGVLQVIVNRGELPDLEPLLSHCRDVVARHGELRRRHKVDRHLLEEVQPLHLRVDRSAVVEVSDQGEVNPLG